ncbi:hypothetical protein [Acidithiobacillus ferrooxidans]|uniref:hypothetical protein n=1 Tax=Acidithiobacillus ferrooxidans TaxID=920 RepID=UPI0013D64EB9|nr:hypothetical protein [Acidithiobacillus ferrooxidans]
MIWFQDFAKPNISSQRTLTAHFMQSGINGHGIVQSYSGNHGLNAIEHNDLPGIIFGLDALWGYGDDAQDRPVAGISHQIAGLYFIQTLDHHRINFLVQFVRRRFCGYALQGAVVSGEALHGQLRMNDLAIILPYAFCDSVVLAVEIGGVQACVVFIRPLPLEVPESRACASQSGVSQIHAQPDIRKPRNIAHIVGYHAFQCG